MDARDHRRFLRTPLALAVEGGHVVAAGMLLDHGAHVDASDADGRTPLFRCAARTCVCLLYSARQLFYCIAVVYFGASLAKNTFQ